MSDLDSEIQEQAYLEDVRMGIKDPGIKCVVPYELSLQNRIVGILESIKVSVYGEQDDFGAPEGGWPTPVMDRVRDIVNGF